MFESPVERLVKTHPDMEIWWDSSPLVYDQWVRKMLNAAKPPHKAVLEEQLSRLYNAETPAKSIFRGCTTNPSLSWQAVQADPEFWNEWLDDDGCYVLFGLLSCIFQPLIPTKIRHMLTNTPKP